MMSMNPDLFHAILAMDAYNRGYGAAIKDLPSAPGTQIGTATIVDTKGDIEAASASFYAIAYNWDGGTVISYRGTDVLSSDLAASMVSRSSLAAGQAHG
jgi:hypothetical protein